MHPYSVDIEKFLQPHYSVIKKACRNVNTFRTFLKYMTHGELQFTPTGLESPLKGQSAGNKWVLTVAVLFFGTKFKLGGKPTV